MRDITDKPAFYSKGDYNTFMSTITPEEHDRLLSENVQIEVFFGLIHTSRNPWRESSML